MSNFDKFRNRVGQGGVENQGEAYWRNTEYFINEKFSSASTFKVLNVLSSTEYPNMEQIDARIISVERMGSIREAILRPNEDLNVGAVVEFDGETYLVYDRHGGTASRSVKLVMARCNRQVRWIDENDNPDYPLTIDENTFTDDFIIEVNDESGNPNTVYNFPCVASATDLGSKSKQSKDEIMWDKYDVKLPQGKLFVFVENNEHTQKIKLNQRFVFGRNVYEVEGVDDVTGLTADGHGVIQFTIKLDISKNHDDFEYGIAQNDYSEEPDSTGDGGMW